ncbi:BA71V-EP152R [African swine fever virus]|uniref:BA71V-EP152R n=1 Tax=African swine fever virus TaxID=10497 RepID=A0A0C5AZE7_ASF|nr:BA71V-EP152R [African swine fever virus]AJL34070.1 BA71V-EP152R [African swine fever virus]
MYSIIIACLVLLLCLIIYFGHRADHALKYLEGMWHGDPVFLKQSGLQSFYLYIQPGHTCFFSVVNKKGEKLMETKIHCTITNKIYMFFKPIFEFHVIMEHTHSYFPKQFNFLLDSTEGKLILENNHVIYAVLYKDNFATALGKTIQKYITQN